VRKIVVTALALILMLGAMGIGYAMWSDEIYVEGYVHTGNVEIEVTGYSGTEVYKDLDTDEVVVLTWKDTRFGRVYSGIPPANNILVASAGAGMGQDADHVVMTYNNLFPLGCLSYCADFGGVYTGSIPVHAAACLYTEYGWLQQLWDMGYITYIVQTKAPGGQWVDWVDGVVQLHEGYEYNVKLCVSIPQEIYSEIEQEWINTQAWLSGQTGSFIGKILVYNWNETPPPTLDCLPAPAD
jgi:hypothetical protein